MALAAAAGLCMAAYICVVPLAATEMYGIRNLNFATGMFYFFFGIGDYLGPPLLGFLFDLFRQNYTETLTLVGIVYGAASTLGVIAFIFDKMSSYALYEIISSGRTKY